MAALSLARYPPRSSRTHPHARPATRPASPSPRAPPRPGLEAGLDRLGRALDAGEERRVREERRAVEGEQWVAVSRLMDRFLFGFFLLFSVINTAV